MSGADLSILMGAAGRLGIAQSGLLKASTDDLPALIDVSPDDRGVMASSVREATALAQVVADWADGEIREQERLAAEAKGEV